MSEKSKAKKSNYFFILICGMKFTEKDFGIHQKIIFILCFIIWVGVLMRLLVLNAVDAPEKIL